MLQSFYAFCLLGTLMSYTVKANGRSDVLLNPFSKADVFVNVVTFIAVLLNILLIIYAPLTSTSLIAGTWLLVSFLYIFMMIVAYFAKLFNVNKDLTKVSELITWRDQQLFTALMVILLATMLLYCRKSPVKIYLYIVLGILLVSIIYVVWYLPGVVIKPCTSLYVNCPKDSNYCTSDNYKSSWWLNSLVDRKYFLLDKETCTKPPPCPVDTDVKNPKCVNRNGKIECIARNNNVPCLMQTDVANLNVCPATMKCKSTACQNKNEKFGYCKKN